MSVRMMLAVTLASVMLSVSLWAGAQPEEEDDAAVSVAVPSGRFNEAPMLAEMVARGELPPVDERLPLEPKVHHMIEGIGKYGGELNVFGVGENIWQNDLQGQMGSSLFRIAVDDAMGTEPDLAAGSEISADNTAITIFLREGLKWSDGHPLTTEDIRFAYENMHWNPNVYMYNPPRAVQSVEVIDDYTIRLLAPDGLGQTELLLSGHQGGFTTGFQPAHYLKHWHLDFNPDAKKIAEEEGFDTWHDALRSHYFWAPLKDPDLPSVEPWRLIQRTPTVTLRERNPYFWRVDPEGNQLPYIDRLVIQHVNADIYALKVSGGQAAIAYYQTKFTDLPIYKANEAVGDYRVILFPTPSAAALKYVAEGMVHKNPAVSEVFSQLDFRRALSVALNRDEVNEVLYQGLGKPGKVAPLENVSFYKEGWRTDWAQYDPELANRLLDGVGMAERDGQGFRLLPDGTRFTFVIEFSEDRAAAELELYKEYYEDVGIRTVLKQEEWGLFRERQAAGEVMAWVHPNPMVPFAGERKLFQNHSNWMQGANPWLVWERSHKEAIASTLEEGASLPSNYLFMDAPAAWEYPERAREPAADWKQIREDSNVWYNLKPGSPEWRALGQEIMDWYVEEWFDWIGAVGEVPAIVIAKNNLGNVVTPGLWPGIGVSDVLVQSWADQLYWK